MSIDTKIQGITILIEKDVKSFSNRISSIHGNNTFIFKLDRDVITKIIFKR